MTGLTIPFIGIKRQYDNLRSEILDITDRVLRSGQIMDGNYTAEFEHWLAKRNDQKYAITCHSGTQALEIVASFVQLSVKLPPPVALLPALTFPATANALIRTGWDLHFVDVNRYGIIDNNRLPINKDFDLAVMVGLYGISIKKSVSVFYEFIIEDAAQHWLSHNCNRITTSTLSFDPTKNLANFGNGGAITTNEQELYNYAKSWRAHGKPDYSVAGSNSRMSEVDCAQMMVKTKYIDAWQKRRADISKYWMELFEKASITTLITKENFATHAYHKFVIEIDHRNLVKEGLSKDKIETKIHYEKPLHEYPAYSKYPGPGMLSCASSLSRRVLSLPLYPELTDLEVDYIADRVISRVNECRSKK